MNFQATMDRAAIGFSAVCAAHCALLPVLLVMVPAVAATPLGDEAFHKFMIMAALPTSLIALTMGCKKHRKWSVSALVLVGLAILVGAAAFGHDLLGENGEKIATLIGAVLLSVGHIQNQRMCAQSECCSS